MSLFQWKALRAFVRRHTKPIQETQAHVWKKRLSIGYMLLAWNAFGFVLYMVWKGKGDWAKDLKSPEELQQTPAQHWAKTLGIKDAKVYRISGFNVTSYEIHDGQKTEIKEENEKSQQEKEVLTN